VTNESQVRNWIQNTVDKFGKHDGAANMAGVIGSGLNKRRLEDRKRMIGHLSLV
jgi:hypothetical protein